jgi:hypothetical protein
MADAAGPSLKIEPSRVAVVHRVGHLPDPWRWIPWEFAPFRGRWDDPQGQYRVIYAGTTAYACYVEVLAPFRQDVALVADISEILGDSRDAAYPTIESGTVPCSWFGPRRIGSAALAGQYVDVQHATTIAELRPRFVRQALSLGFPDFDGAAIRSAEPRALTQAISRFLYLHTSSPDGVRFDSRHGNGLGLFAVFERQNTTDDINERCAHLSNIDAVPVDPHGAEFEDALQLHHLALQVGC